MGLLERVSLPKHKQGHIFAAQHTLRKLAAPGCPGGR